LLATNPLLKVINNEKYNYEVLVITGPTASGKTNLAANVALKVGGEVISADSRQVYRNMNIGSGKDYDDYVIGDIRVPVHLIDIAEAGYKYNVFEYQRDFRKVYTSLRERSVFPVVCGGSGMYIDSIIKGYRLAEVPPDNNLRLTLEKKPMEELVSILEGYRKLHNKTDIDTKKRVIRAIEIEHHKQVHGTDFSSFTAPKALVVGIMLNRDERRKRISERLHKRLSDGMVDEVENLIRMGVSRDTLIYYGLEYKYITQYIDGLLSYNDMVSSLEIAIHQFAKRQMTWFRGMERKGTVINWIDGSLSIKDMTDHVMTVLN